MERPSAPATYEERLLADVPVPIFAIDAAWRLTFMNAIALRLLKARGHELFGRSLWDSFPGLRGTLAERELRRAMRDRVPVSYMRESDVVSAWLLVRVAPHGDGLLIALDDVSELKQAQERAEWLAAEQAALARIADAVARGDPPATLFSAVAREVAALHEVENGAVFRFIGQHEFEVVGSAQQMPIRIVADGAVGDDERGIFDPVRRARAPVYGLVEELGDELGRDLRSVGRRSWLQLPIFAGGGLWGAIALTSARPDAFDPETVGRLSGFAELVRVAIDNADAHRRLERMAATDSLTGLANHRVFHTRLREAVDEATRTGSPLSVALFDLDRIGDVNDLHGHLAGDAALAEVGERLAAVAQPWQLVARVGGDEFGMILPGLGEDDGRDVVERVRAAIAARPFGEQRSELTTSAGIADLASAGHGELLFACADGALYLAKRGGGDLVRTFDPSLAEQLTPRDRAETLLRRQTLAGITALARAIDAKDPSTREHSERVARLVERLARVRGWDERRVRPLREAALVHDVGKIGVPDAILRHSGALTDEQWEIVRRHAALGAEIVAGVLTDEQTQWVRSHHERADGNGYPDRLRGEEIPDGAALLSVADALDVMAIGRAYSAPMTLDAAVTRCEQLAGTQFVPEATAALRALHRAGELMEWDRVRS